MTKIVAQIIIFQFLLICTGYAQDGKEEQITSKVSDYLRIGNASGLTSFFGNNVDLTVLEKDDVYSKSQAEQILAKFFRDYSPKQFNLVHKGKSKQGTLYRIGELNTKNGNFRITFYIKDNSGQFLIQQLRIEQNLNE